jgi:hypothetical protein
VTVGNGAGGNGGLEEQGSTVRARKLELMRPWPSALGMEPESSMEAAADVVDAIAIAAGASPIYLSASSPSLPLAWAHLAVTTRSWLASQPEF